MTCSTTLEIMEVVKCVIGLCALIAIIDLTRTLKKGAKI